MHTKLSPLMRKIPLLGLCVFVSGCSYIANMNQWASNRTEAITSNALVEEATISPTTKSEMLLHSLPPAANKVVVSVYGFQDQTGQNKPNETQVEYSRAVTQGGLAILNEALLDAGRQGWFTVVERNGLTNLLQERKIINAMRQEYSPPGGSVKKLKPLLYAGMLLEGGIVSYDSNTVTGGVGARYLGIGANTQHRRDIVTVYLRAISVNTGEVLLSVNTSKTIYSTAIQGDIFHFVSFDKLLEFETGVTYNEPPQLAVRQAIETAVYSLIMEGARQKIWHFGNPGAGQMALQEYQMRLDGKAGDLVGQQILQDQRQLLPGAQQQQYPAPVRQPVTRQAPPRPIAMPAPAPTTPPVQYYQPMAATSAPVTPVQSRTIQQPVPASRLQVQAGSAPVLNQRYYSQTNVPVLQNQQYQQAPLPPAAYQHSPISRRPVNSSVQ